MPQAHQPGQSAFRSILPEAIDWKPFPAFPPSARGPRRRTLKARAPTSSGLKCLQG